MAKEYNDLVVGLDIGTAKVMAVVAEVLAGGELRLAGLGVAPSHGLKRGVVVNIDATMQSIQQALKEAEMMADCKISRVYTGISGSHVRGRNSTGMVIVRDKEVSALDVARVVDTAKAINIPNDQRLLLVEPQEFVIDGQEVREPVGMSGARLEVRVHIVTGAHSAAENIVKCVRRCGLEVEQLVLNPSASSQSVLTPDEKDLGVALVDIGAGTTSIAVYEENTLLHTAVLPLGGLHITNDLAIGLRTSIDTAERVKILYGHANPDSVDKHVTIDLSKLDESETEQVDRREVVEIIEARLGEIFEYVNKELKLINRDGKLPAGVVLVGGTANLPGIAEYAKSALRLPAGRGQLQGLRTIIDRVDDPSFAVVCGLVLWSSAFATASAGGFGSSARRLLENPNMLKLKRWFKSFLP